jgi:peptidylprolyl isomerase
VFLFEKKNQKTFANLAYALPQPAHQGAKVFCFFFSKKKAFFATLAAVFAPGWGLAAEWKVLDPDNTLVIDSSRGRIVVAMAPQFAPLAVARVKQLAREHVYDGLLFHRVIDGFVDQTGNPNNHDGGVSSHPDLPPEFLFPLNDAQISAVVARRSDGISGFVGVQPFAAMAVPGKAGHWRAWGAYCAGVAGMGRQAAITTANSEIFFMRAPARRLDHDYAVWGFVVAGLDAVRGAAVGEPPAHPDRMVRVRVMADIAAGERPDVAVMDTASAAFGKIVQAARAKFGADFSVCDVGVPVREGSGAAR